MEEEVAQIKSGFNSKKGELIVSNVDAGETKNDGFKISQIGVNTFLKNQEEKANINLITSGAKIFMDGGEGRISVATTSGAQSNKGAFNIVPVDDNALFLRCIKKGNIGLTIKMKDEVDVAFKVLDYNNKINFSILDNGHVYARKYTTTLNNIPDYVFDEDYDLMSVDELEKYIASEHHLPNIPSADEYKKEGVDLGEMNRLLLEKVEELTLYIIELNKEMEEVKKINK